MKHELIENIKSVQSFIDLNDEHVFKKVRLNELRTESKTVLYYPDYLMQVRGREGGREEARRERGIVEGETRTKLEKLKKNFFPSFSFFSFF